MKLIIAQGNPGREYDGTRHNTGFRLADAVAEHYGATWQEKPKFKAFVTEFAVGSERVTMAKPTTFYNLTGECAAVIAHFYRLSPQDVLAIHDELALPVGTVRTRLGGSDAGNNGVKSLIAHLGPDFARIRVGIAGDHLRTDNATDYVLGRFTQQEREDLGQVVPHVIDFVEHFAHQEKEFQPTSVKTAQK